MKKPLTISEEMLNIFVDDELDNKEREQILEEQMHDKELAQAICKIRQLKDLVKSARPQVDITNTTIIIKKGNGSNRPGWVIAASIFLLLGASMIALISNHQDNTRPGTPIASARLYSNVNTLLTAQNNTSDIKVVLHINKNDPVAYSSLVMQLEHLLNETKDNDRHFHIEVIASGPGINFITNHASPYVDKIHLFREKYDGLAFVACQSTLAKLRKSNNTDVNILPDAVLTASGIELIRLRKSQGWSYISI